jgi:quinol monooxygenase YgiN
VYKDKAAFDTHVNTPHMVKFRSTIKDEWFETPRSAVRCMSVFPADKDWR